jgi:hypothetical protein
VNFVASFGINTIAAGIVYELNALVCSLFNQVCQMFSINMASMFILVKCNTVYDSFSRWKAFFYLPYFFALLCIGVWAGGAWGARPPPQIFYGRAKTTAKFGQNIKISENF